MLPNNGFLSKGLAGLVGLAFGAAILAGCSDSGTRPAADAATTGEKSPSEQAAAIDKMRTEFATANSAEMMKRAEALWAAKDYAGGAALAGMAYKKDGNSNAAYRLGTAYQGGYGVKKDLNKAWEYLSNPALDNVSYALYFRGLVQSDKDFSNFDVAMARMNFERAKAMGVGAASDPLNELSK